MRASVSRRAVPRCRWARRAAYFSMIINGTANCLPKFVGTLLRVTPCRRGCLSPDRRHRSVACLNILYCRNIIDTRLAFEAFDCVLCALSARRPGRRSDDGAPSEDTLCCCNDPYAGSPTKTLLRLLLPRSDQVRITFYSRRGAEAPSAASGP